jgi:hypothetical protein
LCAGVIVTQTPLLAAVLAVTMAIKPILDITNRRKTQQMSVQMSTAEVAPAPAVSADKKNTPAARSNSIASTESASPPASPRGRTQAANEAKERSTSSPTPPASPRGDAAGTADDDTLDPDAKPTFGESMSVRMRAARERGERILARLKRSNVGDEATAGMTDEGLVRCALDMCDMCDLCRDRRVEEREIGQRERKGLH